VLADGRAPREATTVRALWDDRYLYVAFDITDDDLVAKDFKMRTEDAVQVLIDADRNAQSYVQLATNPRATKLSFAYVAPGQLIAGWDSHMKLAVRVVGALHDHQLPDRGWTVELAVPLDAAMGRAKSATAVRNGARWRINFVRDDSSTRAPHETSAWSPTSADDDANTFGTLEFAE
jgi:hypothetical protein